MKSRKREERERQSKRMEETARRKRGLGADGHGGGQGTAQSAGQAHAKRRCAGQTQTERDLRGPEGGTERDLGGTYWTVACSRGACMRYGTVTA